MLRLLGFFLAVLAGMWLLRHVPGLSWLGRSLLGFWIMALVVSALSAWGGTRLVARRAMRRGIRALGEVDTPHNRGKLGALLLAGGRAREAAAQLEHAAEREPEVLEWRYRLGLALRACKRHEEAREALAQVARRDPEHAYGAVRLRLAECELVLGRAEASLAVLREFEADHGENPESAYRTALALRALGRRAEARAHFARTRRLAAKAPAFQRREARSWALRALLASPR